MAAKQKKVKLPSLKAIGQAVLKYREGRKAGTVAYSSEMEKLSPFFGKKGQVLKRETRYNKQREALKEAAEKARKKYGSRPGYKSFKREEQKQQEKQAKGAKTFAEHQAPKTKKGEIDKRFKRQAREKIKQFNTMVDIFASESYNELTSGAYGIGSDVVQAMAEAGLSADEAIKYLDQVKQTLNDIPEEAREFAMRDDFWQAVVDLSKMVNETGGIDFKDAFGAYLQSEDHEGFEQAMQNYADIDGDKPAFSEVWKELEGSIDSGNPDTMQEIIDNWEGQEE